MPRLLLSLACTLCWCNAWAGELLLHGPSYHFERPTPYNEQNYGLGYRFDNNVVAGFYQNSLERTSVYAGYFLRFNDYAGILLGAVTGYETLPVQPAAVLTFSLPVTERWRVHLNLVPFKAGLVNVALGYELR